MELEEEEEEEEEVLGNARHRTRSSSPLSQGFTTRSAKTSRRTRPGSWPQTKGEVHRAVLYATRPLAEGRCGWEEGKRWRAMWGERISEGRGDCRRVGREDCRVRIAVGMLA